ncbi:MAG: hypothetical protein H6658_16700 [Ardenticatenaceae bacterium]|nr:hypothetical protein [Ardenticatenaceae bacterium]
MDDKSHKIVVILLIMFLVACRLPSNANQPDIIDTPTVREDHSIPTPLPTVEWTAELENLRADVLGDSCEFPCALSIDPGLTPADTVPIILEQLKQEGTVEDFYLVDHPVSKSYAVLFEDFSGNITIDESKNLVTSVGFGLSNKFLTLGNVIDVYGEPSSVAYGRGDSFEGLYIAYSEQEIFLWVRTDSLRDQLVTPEMTVVTLSYLSSGAPNSELEQPHIVWIDWEGYKPIYYYYEKLLEVR